MEGAVAAARQTKENRNAKLEATKAAGDAAEETATPKVNTKWILVHTAASLFKDLLQGGTWSFLLFFAAILPIDCKVCTEQWCSFLCQFQLCPILVSSLGCYLALKIKLKWINDDVSTVHFVIFGVIFGFICWFTLTTYREETLDNYDIEWLKINCGEPWVTSHTLQNGTIEWKRAEKEPDPTLHNCEKLDHAHRLKACASTMANNMFGNPYVKKGHESCNEFWERASGNAAKYVSWVDNTFNLLPTVKEMAKTEELKLEQAYSEITWWYGLATCMFIAATCASCVNTVGKNIPQAWFWIYIGLFLYASVSTYAYATSQLYKNFHAFKTDCVHALRVPMQWVSDCISNWSTEFKEDQPGWIVISVMQIAAVNILGFLFDRQCQTAIFIVYVLVIAIITVKFNYAAIRANIGVVRSTLVALCLTFLPTADGFSVHGNTQYRARQMLLAQRSSLLPDDPWWLVLAFMFCFGSVLYYGIWQWRQADFNKVFSLGARVFMCWSGCNAINSFTSFFQHWVDHVQCFFIMYHTVLYILNPYKDQTIHRLQRVEEALRLTND